MGNEAQDAQPSRIPAITLARLLVKKKLLSKNVIQEPGQDTGLPETKKPGITVTTKEKKTSEGKVRPHKPQEEE
jgi:hypothetical protein